MANPKTMARTPSATGLYWSERGHIGCAHHTPYEGSDSWIWERWEAVPVAAIAEAKRLGQHLRCETCRIGPEAPEEER
jgi:hypothetical protein